MRTLDSRLEALNKRVVKINPLRTPDLNEKVAKAFPEIDHVWERFFKVAERDGIESAADISMAYMGDHPEIRPLLDQISEYLCTWAERQEPRLNYRRDAQKWWCQD